MSMLRKYFFVLFILLFFTLVACTKEEKLPVEIPIADGDHDGITDLSDECPDTVQGMHVGKKGCSASELRTQAITILEGIPTETLTKQEKNVLHSAISNISFSMDPSLYNNNDLTCKTIIPFAFAQKAAVQALENLSCILDDASFVNATEENDYYTAIFQKDKKGKVVINASNPDNAISFYEYVEVSCPKITQIQAGQALEKILSANFIFVNDVYQGMTCEEEGAKDGALRNLEHSVENYDAGRYQFIVDNLGLAWGYVHQCDCGNPFELQ